MPYDWVFEPVSKHNGYDAASRRWSFDSLVAMVNAWGVPLERLSATLGADGESLVHALLDRLRRAAEPLRPFLEEHLDRGALAEVLPPPDRRLRSRSPLRAGSPIRLLCGLAFVLDRNRHREEAVRRPSRHGPA